MPVEGSFISMKQMKSQKRLSYSINILQVRATVKGAVLTVVERLKKVEETIAEVPEAQLVGQKKRRKNL